MTLNDQVLPELLRIRGELEKLRACTIHVGIQGDADSDILMIAHVHEYGATIKAKNAKNLCIPINKLSYDKSPRDFDSQGLFFFRSHNGFLLAAIPKQGKKKRRKKKGEAEGGGEEQDDIELLFLLLPSVTIPERSFIRAGFDANRDNLAAEFQKVIGKIMHEGWTAERAANYIGGAAVGFIRKYINDAGHFKPKGKIQRERSGSSFADSPLVVTNRLLNSITWKVEGME